MNAAWRFANVAVKFIVAAFAPDTPRPDLAEASPRG
jgi:hypothetical protein